MSTLMHAGWNLFARFNQSGIRFFNKMLLYTLIIGLIPFIISELVHPCLDLDIWIYAFFSGILNGLYFFSLAHAYRSSDFSMVYPLTRALPILLLAFWDFLRGTFISTSGYLGIILVILGCFIIPLKSFKDFKLKSYINHTLFWVLLIILGNIGYTMFDKIAVEKITHSPFNMAKYAYSFFIFAYPSYLLFLKIFKPKSMININNSDWKAPLLGTLMNFTCYTLILWAYQLTQQTSYVVALRQVSIVIGVILAFLVYKEKIHLPRFISILLIFIGLILIIINR